MQSQKMIIFQSIAYMRLVVSRASSSGECQRIKQHVFTKRQSVTVSQSSTYCVSLDGGSMWMFHTPNNEVNEVEGQRTRLVMEWHISWIVSEQIELAVTLLQHMNIGIFNMININNLSHHMHLEPSVAHFTTTDQAAERLCNYYYLSRNDLTCIYNSFNQNSNHIQYKKLGKGTRWTKKKSWKSQRSRDKWTWLFY